MGPEDPRQRVPDQGVAGHHRLLLRLLLRIRGEAAWSGEYVDSPPGGHPRGHQQSWGLRRDDHDRSTGDHSPRPTLRQSGGRMKETVLPPYGWVELTGTRANDVDVVNAARVSFDEQAQALDDSGIGLI